MPGTRAPDAPLADLSPDEALKAYHRVVRVPGEHFEVDGYRYTNLADAMAQSRRGRATDRA